MALDYSGRIHARTPTLHATQPGRARPPGLVHPSAARRIAPNPALLAGFYGHLQVRYVQKTSRGRPKKLEPPAQRTLLSSFAGFSVTPRPKEDAEPASQKSTAKAGAESRTPTSSNSDTNGHFSSHARSGSSNTGGSSDSSIDSSSSHASSVHKLPGVWEFDASLQAKAPIPPAEDCRRIAAELLMVRVHKVDGFLPLVLLLLPPTLRLESLLSQLEH
eukprot:6183138-Pleurochrysis_carterae.AAC.11